MSTVRRETPAELVGGFLSAMAIAVAAIGIVHKPVRLIPAAFVLAVIAAGIGGPHRRLAAIAVGVATVAFVVGMTIAVWTSNPLY